MGKLRILVVALMCGSVFTGCANYLMGRSLARNKNVPGASAQLDPVDLSTRALCDVTRARARMELLKRYDVDHFRAIMLKISKEVTSEEIDGLRKMADIQIPGRGLPPGLVTRRGELVSSIYKGALIRSGFKINSNEIIRENGVSYSIGIDPLSAGNDLYVILMQGHIAQTREEEGSITQVLLGVNPDQTRYYVGFNRFSRYETQADGTRVPVYESTSLADAAEESVPRYCVQAGSALNVEEFNTIAGLNGRDSLFPPSALPRITPPAVPAPAVPAPVTPVPPTPARPTPLL